MNFPLFKISKIRSAWIIGLAFPGLKILMEKFSPGQYTRTSSIFFCKKWYSPLNSTKIKGILKIFEKLIKKFIRKLLFPVPVAPHMNICFSRSFNDKKNCCFLIFPFKILPIGISPLFELRREGVSKKTILSSTWKNTNKLSMIDEKKKIIDKLNKIVGRITS